MRTQRYANENYVARSRIGRAFAGVATAALAVPPLAVGCGATDPMVAAGGSTATGVSSAGTSNGGAGASSSTSAGQGSGGTTPGGAASVSGAGGSGDAAGSGGGGNEELVSYSRQVAPIFSAAGCSLCHHTNSAVGVNIDDPFDADDGLVNSVNTWAEAHPEGMTPALNLTPGDVDESFIVQKITDQNIDVASAGEFMPWSIPRLTDAELADLRTWITDGAEDDAFFASNIRPIFGDATKLGAAGGKCTYCHYEGGQGPNLSDPFDPATGAVGVASILSAKMRVEPGDPDASFLVEKVEATTSADTVGAPMPYQFAPLTEQQVATVVAWIEQGALDN